MMSVKTLTVSGIKGLLMTWKEEIKKLKQCPQRQDSTSEQLKDLIQVANKLGFYDASDFLRKYVHIDKLASDSKSCDIVSE